MTHAMKTFCRTWDWESEYTLFTSALKVGISLTLEEKTKILPYLFEVLGVVDDGETEQEC